MIQILFTKGIVMEPMEQAKSAVAGTEMASAASVMEAAYGNHDVNEKVDELIAANVNWYLVFTVLVSCYADIRAGDWAAVLAKLQELLPQKGK